MTADDVVRELAGTLLDEAANAWAHDCPVLASRLYDAAHLLVRDVGLEPTTNHQEPA
jgi:hypothetical protein